MGSESVIGVSERFARVASWVVFVAIPAALLAGFLEHAHRHEIVALDFHYSFWPAGRSVLDGNFAYPADIGVALSSSDPFVYPPLTAVAFAPIALVPRSTADVLYTIFSIAAPLLALRLLGVRDWRCYGIVFAWTPVLAAVQVGNLSLLLVVLLAVAWRLRDRPVPVGLVAAVAISAKLFLWPVLAWLVLTKRYKAAASTVVFAIGLNAVAWVAIDGGSLAHYVRLLRRLGELEGPFAYTVTALAQRSGIPASVSEGLTWLVAGVLLYACWRSRRDERVSFGLVVIVALIASPIVWLHYFALLVIPVALTRTTLSWPWFVPVAMVVCTGQGNGTYAQTVVALLTLAVVAASLFSVRREPVPAVIEAPA